MCRREVGRSACCVPPPLPEAEPAGWAVRDEVDWTSSQSGASQLEYGQGENGSSVSVSMAVAACQLGQEQGENGSGVFVSLGAVS